MKHLRILSVAFDTSIQPWQLPQFRGAVAKKVGLEHDWFHNHDNENNNFYQRYPLIQYKIDARKEQMRPMLLFLNDGIEEAQHFFSQPDWGLRIGQQDYDMRIARLQVHQHNLHTWEQPFHYRIHKWRALNSEHFREWQALSGIAEKYAFLENILVAHILSFARAVDWQLDQRLELKITHTAKEEWISFKDIKMRCFTLNFSANASLPDFIGLGKGAGVGFGVVKRDRGQAIDNQDTTKEDKAE